MTALLVPGLSVLFAEAAALLTAVLQLVANQ